MGLNLQGHLVKGKVIGGIEWVKQVRADGSEVQGYTANPIGGCFHACQWRMPDDQIAACYAERAARTMTRAYSHGFEHHYWRPELLTMIVNTLREHEACSVFIDSMSDLFGAWVEAWQIRAVFDTIRRLPHITFFSLTKNAPRLSKFMNEFPGNLRVGVSMPPDVFKGKTLSAHQKERMLRKAFEVLWEFPQRLITWMSFEPLSWDVSPIVAEYSRAIDWAVIGAASRGRTYYQPRQEHVDALEDVLRGQHVPVFYKGNLQREPRREEFPWEVRV